MQPLIQDAVKEQIDNAFLPWRYVEHPALSVEVVFEPDRRSKAKMPARQCAVNCIEPAQPARSKVIKRLAISRRVKGFTPMKEGPCIDADRCLVQFRFAVDLLPSETTACTVRPRVHSDRSQFVLPNGDWDKHLSLYQLSTFVHRNFAVGSGNASTGASGKRSGKIVSRFERS